MDYKKIIKSRKLRIRIMQLLNFIPDKMMIQMQYRMKTGRRLNLRNPKRFTEKIQWYKLYYRDSLMEQCVDKYEVRQYLERCGLGNHLNELYGLYDSPAEIDFDALPNSFVLKDTLGCGGNSVILVPDKSKLDIETAMQQMREWVNVPLLKKHPGREWVYDHKKHRIIAEKYLEDANSVSQLVDYKFFCFYGKPEYLYVMKDRKAQDEVTVGIFRADYTRVNVQRKGKAMLPQAFLKPQNYDMMLSLARKIGEPFPQARIDMYNIDGEIIFGEITFFSASGYMMYEPDDFDFVLGEKFILPKSM